MSVDELEALRLADLEGFYQNRAVVRMGVSRPTFARIIEASRRKVAEALVLGRAIRIAGGPVALGVRTRTAIRTAVGEKARSAGERSKR